MKFKKSAVVLTSLISLMLMVSCGSSDNADDVPSTASSKTVTTQEATTKKKLISQNEAARAAQKSVESQLARCNVIGGTKGSKKAAKYDTVLYGDCTCELNSSTNTYTFNIKGTCWAYDSYGNSIDKFNFEAESYVDASTGFATSNMPFLKSK